MTEGNPRPCVEHDFVRLNLLEVEQPETTKWLVGRVIVCAFCGEVRHVWANGKVEIVKRGSRL